MIVRMSKVAIAGPKGLLQEVLSLLQESGIFHLEPNTVGFVDRIDEKYIRSFLPDERSLSERLFLEDLQSRTNELFSYLPEMPAREIYIEPRLIIDAVAKTISGHIETCKDLYQKKNALRKELNELSRYAVLMDTLESLLVGVETAPELDFIGLAIKDAGVITHLRRLLESLTDDKFEVLTAPAKDGTIMALITTEKHMSEKVKKMLSDEHIPELGFPPSFEGLPFPEKIKHIQRRILEISSSVRAIDSEMERFFRRWMPLYKAIRKWIDERLSLLKAAGSVFETRMCFFIYGWIPSEEVKRLRRELTGAFEGKVAMAEKELYEEELDRVPVVLRNPAYFRPFELFAKLLPLPRYASFDPTPFIGIFFPVFFGMILGDAGYGLILIIASLIVMKKFSSKKNIQDASKILLISSGYTVFFGILYGEFFGGLGEEFLGMKPICIERQRAVLPMLFFTLTVGAVHILIGMIFGFLSALKKKARRETLYRFLNITMVLCVIVLTAVFFGVFPDLLARPIIIAILILTPLLLFAGGLLAPFELLKNIGNIISYTRIMAIGLTSVLLAFVANRIAGMLGNIVMGIVVAALLHLLNIIIGVFSPTIHSLRLHYVEFFSKFMEHGGRKFEPLKK